MLNIYTDEKQKDATSFDGDKNERLTYTGLNSKTPENHFDFKEVSG